MEGHQTPDGRNDPIRGSDGQTGDTQNDPIGGMEGHQAPDGRNDPIRGSDGQTGDTRNDLIGGTVTGAGAGGGAGCVGDDVAGLDEGRCAWQHNAGADVGAWRG